MTETRESDEWSRWLLERRHAGDDEYQRQVRAVVEKYRDRVLDGLKLGPGMTMVDIGAGDGLLSFEAIWRIGPTLKVILTDVSQPLLRHAEKLAIEKSVANQCSFVACSAEQLDGIRDVSVDAVGVRAVLAYVQDKAAAFREFFRVLKPGGRLSIAEPIFQDEAIETCGMARMIQSRPDHPEIRYMKLLLKCRSAQFPSNEGQVLLNPMTNYNERDLFRLAREARFSNIRLELTIELRPTLTKNWNVYMDAATHPQSPTLREIMAKHFTTEEAAEFERMLRPAVEKGETVQREINVYLTAEKLLGG